MGDASEPSPAISAELQRALLDEHTDYLSVIDAQGRLVYANRGLTRLFGWEVSDFQSTSNLELVHPDDRVRIMGHLRDSLATPGLRIAAEFRLRCKDGSYRYVESDGINLLHDARVRGIVSTTRDVTARKRAEAEVARSREDVDRQLNFARTLHRIAEAIAGTEELPAMLDAMVRIIGEGLQLDRCQILDVDRTRGVARGLCEWRNPGNPAAFSILGEYPLAQFPHSMEQFWSVRQPIISHASDPSPSLVKEGMVDFLHRELASQSLYLFPFNFRSDGFYLLGLDQVSRHRDWRDDEQIFVQSVAMHVNLALQKHQILAERRLAEEQLRQSQKMEAIGRLAGGIAHDFNNLLTAIIGYSDLLDLNLHDERLRRYVHGIHQVANRASATTHQLLAFSRQQVLKPQVFELNAMMRGIEDMLRRLIGERIELRFELDPQAGCVRMDPVQLELALVNLAVNARDAMPQGGQLSLSTASMALPAELRMKLHISPGEFSRIQVRDTGVGMASEVLEHLFEPFFTTKEIGKGTGLGLSSVYGIVHTAGGGIDVSSTPGTGSTFDLYLPRDFSPLQSSARASEVLPASGGQETVLMVEDDDILRELLSDALRSYGYQVLVARDGAEALRHSSAHACIDLVLSDVVMPQMDGPMLAKALRSRHPDIRLLFMSGYTADAFADKPELARIPILAKPFAIEELVRAVRLALDGGGVSSPARR